MQTTDNPYVVARRKEEIKQGKELEGILNAVCLHLNRTEEKGTCKWFVEMSRDSEDNEIRNCGYLKGPNGFSLFVAPSYRFANKLHISVSWPRDPDKLACYFEPRSDEMDGVTEINVSRNKECRLIANDIRNRLLPDGMRIFAKVQERVKSHAGYAQRKRAMAEQFSVAMGLEFEERHIEEIRQYLGKNYTGTRLEVRPSDKTVDLKIVSLDPNMAIQIIHMLQTRAFEDSMMEAWDRGEEA